MTLNEKNKWAAAGAIGATALILYNPLTYWFMDMIFMNKGYIAKDKGRCPTIWGYGLHTIVLFFAVYGLLCINWACS